MAAKKWYAWTDIAYRVDGVRKVLRAGEVASQQTLGLDDAGWAELVRTKTVQREQFPPISRQGSNILSPIEYMRQEAKKVERAMETQSSTLTAVLPPDEDDDEPDPS